jgi:hypothetical protein
MSITIGKSSGNIFDDVFGGLPPKPKSGTDINIA